MNNYKLKLILSGFFSVMFIAFFVYNPTVVLDGVRSGLDICTYAVIPSLFPFTVLSDFLVRSGFASIVGRPLEKIGNLLFALPGSACTAVIISLIGGFPVGARMTSQLLSDGEITKAQARRMLIFCVCGGPAFIIGTVGVAMLGSKQVGILLYISVALASIFTAIFLRFFAKNEVHNKEKIRSTFDIGTLPQSISCAVNAILTLCGWIMLFASIISIAESLIDNRTIMKIVTSILEVTNGCANTAGSVPTPLLAGIVAWSGISVHCQLLPSIKAAEIKLGYFILGRAVNAVFSSAIAWLLFKAFPCEVSVFSTATDVLPKTFSISAPAGIAMLFMAAFMLLDLAKKEKV